MDSHDIISGLLNEVFLCIDERIASGEDYSVLETAIKGNEEMMHSSVIASLLDTRGAHGQKCCFLELFLGCLPERFKSLMLPAHGLPVKGPLARRLKTREAGSTSALKTAASR